MSETNDVCETSESTVSSNITTEELAETIARSPESIYIIDVREPDETEQGIIPTAHPIPLHELHGATHMDEKSFTKRYGFTKFRKDEQIVVYCYSGGRSAVAAHILNEKGYKVRNYKGSMNAWSRMHIEDEAI